MPARGPAHDKATSRTPPAGPDEPVHLVKISDLARSSKVPVATIKYYLRTGLLSGATRRTSRNMAYYDARLAERVRAIKRLQTHQALPLRVIAEILEPAPSAALRADAASSPASTPETGRPDDARPDSTAITDAVERARSALAALGLDADLAERAVAIYADAAAALVRREVALYQERLPATGDASAPTPDQVAEALARIGGDILSALRKALLSRMLARMPPRS